MKEIKAPELIPNNTFTPTIFLGGTIDMGNSENWQTKFAKGYSLRDIVFLNPRRDSWGEDVAKDATNPNFYQQVNWEMNAMDKANLIILNFLPDSKSPITLLELGLYATSGKLLVCCPKEFWRSGNVHLVCQKYNIPLFFDIEQLQVHLNTLYFYKKL